MSKNKNLKYYNPYLYLVLDNDFYENDVIEYYNEYKKDYENDREFKDKVVSANDEAIAFVINEFLFSEDEIHVSLKRLREEVRKIKNIVLITEDGNKTKNHIKRIDSRVDSAIEEKVEELGILDEEYYRLRLVYNEFYENEDYDSAVVTLKNDVNEIVNEFEDLYTLRMASTTKKNIINRMNNVINDRAKQTGVYEYFDSRIKTLINKYDEMVVKNSEMYLEWVNNLKNEYNLIKEEMKKIYPSNIYKKMIKSYDSEIDDLIDTVMLDNHYLYEEDELELDVIFTNYENNILDYEFDKYYEYMTDSEKFNAKREMYEDKNRKFKRSIREFNKKMRSKYSNSYADAYINNINKRADEVIKENASLVGMPIPKNPWLIRKYTWADTSNFISEKGLKARKIINPMLKKLVRVAMENKLIVEEKPNLDKSKQYIFVSTHYFTEDVIGLFSSVGKPAYMLMGTTDQIENNPLMLAAMAFGFFHVDRLDKEDRKECFEKQNLLIDNGASFINYIGGGWENSENGLQPPSFSGAYRTSKLKDVLIVPVASYLVREAKKMYMRFGEPLDVRNLEENEANDVIRDTLASMHYKQISKYSYPLDKKKIPYDQHKYYMDQIGDEYWHQPWTKPFAKEEIGPRKRKITTEEEVYSFIDKLPREKLIELSTQLAPIMARTDEKERYDIIEYLDNNYEKFKTKSRKKK